MGIIFNFNVFDVFSFNLYLHFILHLFSVGSYESRTFHVYLLD